MKLDVTEGRRVEILAILVLSSTSRAFAQPADPPVQEVTPEDPKPTTPPPAPAPEPAKTEHVHTMDELTIPQNNVRFGINFFGDTSLALTTPGEPKSSFTIGTLGIRLLGKLSRSVDALAELAFETVEGGSPVADVEQLNVRWHSGASSVELGRSHTNLGYWNTAYHHGLWLQTPIERPRAVRFEDGGGLLPAHWVGIAAAHTINVGDNALTISGGLANGRGDVVDDVRVGKDTNDAKSFLVKVRFKTPVFEVGVGGIYDRIAPVGASIRPALANQRIDEYIANAYFALHADGPLAIAEGYAFRHKAENGDSFMTYAGYGLVGYRIFDWLTPYAAVDTVNGAGDDPFFAPDRMKVTYVDLIEAIAGARIETSTWSAIKIEARLLHPKDLDDEYIAVANWSFGL